jgi:cytochrome P450
MTGRAVVPDGIDLFDPRRFARDGIPYADLARLRAEAPVAWHPEPAVLDWPEGPGFWAVTRFADVSYVSRTPELFSSWLGATQLRDPDPEDLPHIRRMMLNMDPPEHTRLRKLVNTGFTPRRLRAMEPIIRSYAAEVVDRIAPRGECDFAEEVGGEFPLLTLAEIMGAPRSDRHLLYEWTNKIIGYQDPTLADVERDASGRPIHPRSPRSSTLREMFAYAHQLAGHKRRHPADDLISTLVHAEIDGERITDDELEMMFFLFTVAGNDTTHSALPGGMLALLDHPDQLDRLRADLALLPAAVEEMLRYAPPVIHFRRTATTDTDLAGQPVSAGDKVVIFYPSANRDEAVVADPDRFDVGRDPLPQHLTFGFGPHVCLGSALARTQLRVMFAELLTRLPDIELAGPVQRLQSNFINGIRSMPVRFRARSA